MATYIWHGGLELYIANAESVKEAREILIREYDRVHPTEIIDALDTIENHVKFCILIHNAPNSIIGECDGECFDLLKHVNT